MAMFFVILNFGWIATTLGAGVGTAWDVSPDQSTEYTTHPTWPRVDLSAFEVRSISGVGRPQSESSNSASKNRNSEELNIKREAKEIDDMENDYVPEVLFDHPVFKGIFKKPKQHPDVEMLPGPWEKSRESDRIGRNKHTCPESLEEDAQSEEVIRERPRVRRDIEEAQLEKISGTKNVREPRLSSPDSWSKQPLSIEFRHRTNMEGLPTEEDHISRSSAIEKPAPRTEFITASRRSFSETREPRELPAARTFEDLPYRNSFRERDLEMSYPRGYYYPDNFRTERDYLIRGVNDPVFSPERYRIEDYDMYRNRPTPKPKRIIYYATLPEVVRKPIELRRPYDMRPYDNMGRTTIPPTIRDPMYRRHSGIMDSKYGYKSYPYGYDSYDPYIKRSGYWDRPYMPYDRLDEDRYREQDLDHASFKEARGSTTDDGAMKVGNSVESRSQEKLPWPVQIGTELNVKDNERVSGRKIFGQHPDYERLRQSERMERERNEEVAEDGKTRD